MSMLRQLTNEDNSVVMSLWRLRYAFIRCEWDNHSEPSRVIGAFVQHLAIGDISPTRA
jgi:hypothetical protein